MMFIIENYAIQEMYRIKIYQRTVSTSENGCKPKISSPDKYLPVS